MTDIRCAFNIGKSKIIMHYYSGNRHINEQGLIDVLPYYKISIMLTDGLEARFLSGRSRTLKAGDVAVFNPYEAHFGCFLRSGHFEYVEFLVPENALNNVENDEYGLLGFLCESRELYYFLNDGEQAKILDIIGNAVEKCLSGDKLKEMKIGAYFIAFADYLSSIPSSRLQKAPLRIIHPKVKMAMEYISKDFVKIKCMEDVGKKCGCSTRYMSRIFKEYAGISPYEYLVTTRLHNARTMLLSNRSVTEACYDSGFTDYSHFIQVFKKYYGKTPKQFKTFDKQKGFKV